MVSRKKLHNTKETHITPESSTVRHSQDLRTTPAVRPRDGSEVARLLQPNDQILRECMYRHSGEGNLISTFDPVRSWILGVQTEQHWNHHRKDFQLNISHNHNKKNTPRACTLPLLLLFRLAHKPARRRMKLASEAKKSVKR